MVLPPTVRRSRTVQTSSIFDMEIEETSGGVFSALWAEWVGRFSEPPREFDLWSNPYTAAFSFRITHLLDINSSETLVSIE